MFLSRRALVGVLVAASLMTSWPVGTFAESVPQNASATPGISLEILSKLAGILRGFQFLLASQSLPAAVAQQIAAGGSPSYAGAGRIDNLSNTTIQNPTITGGSISGTSVVGTISNAINTAIATVANLVATTITGTNATFTNATTTNATSTNFYTASAVIPSLTGTNAIFANLITTNLAATGPAYFAGTVGIGTSSPASLLALDSTSTTGTILRVANSSTGGHMWDLLSTGSGNTGGAGRFDFFDKTAGSARLSILANGNVGVGTTSPATKFSTFGSGYFTDGFGIGVVNTVPGTLRTSSSATFGGSVNIPTGGSAANPKISFGTAQSGMYGASDGGLFLSTGNFLKMEMGTNFSEIFAQGNVSGATLQLRRLDTVNPTSTEEQVGGVQFWGPNAAGTPIEYAACLGTATTYTVGAEEGYGTCNVWDKTIQDSHSVFTWSHDAVGLAAGVALQRGIFVASPTTLIDANNNAFLANITADQSGTTTTSLNVLGSPNGSGTFSAAALFLESNDHTNFRSLGTYYYDHNGLNEWFAGRPYTNSTGGSDAYIIARNGNVGPNSAGKSTSQIFNALFTVSNTGNIGIGTTSPYAKLSLSAKSLDPTPLLSISTSTASATTTAFFIDQNGNTTIGNNGSIFTVNGATSTHANGINLTAGCFSIAGSCLSLGNSSGTLAISGGGTGQTSFTQGWLSSDGTTITASSSPTVNYITSTSTSATSTFASAGFSIGSTKFVVQQGSGNVGFGTANPSSLLDVRLSASGASTLASFGNVTQGIFGRIGMGNTGTNTFTVLGSSGSNLVLGGGAVESMRLTTGGLVGVGTTTPWRTLSVTGTVGFDGLTGSIGAGSLCLTANKEVVYNSGSDNCLSSIRSTKHNITPLAVDAFAQLAALQPVSFVYNDDASSTVRYGFIAEDTANVDTHLATYNQAGEISGVDDRALLSIVVKALQDLINRFGDLAERLVTKEIVAKNVQADVLTANQKLCIGATCVTEDQLQTLLRNSGISKSSSSQLQSDTNSSNDESNGTTKGADTPPVVPDDMATSTGQLPSSDTTSPTATAMQ